MILLVSGMVSGCGAINTSIRNAYLDKTAPDHPKNLSWIQSSLYAGTTVTASWVPSVSGDLASQRIQFYIGSQCEYATGTGIALSTTTTSQSFTNVDGSYSFRITSVDKKGNVSVSDCSSAITLDTTAPVLTIDTASDWINNANKAAYIISGTCTDSGSSVSGNVTITVTQGANSKSETSACSAGTYSVTLNTTTAAPGAFTDSAANTTISVQASDTLSNSRTITATRGRDIEAPTISISSAPAFISLSNVSSYPVVVACSDATSGISGNATVTMSDGAHTATASGACGATIQLNASTLDDGSSNITITASVSDVAGNSNTSASVTKSKDVVRPTAQLVFASNSLTTRDTNSGTVTLTATSCSDASQVLLTSNTSLVPDANTAGWVSCVTTAGYYPVTEASPSNGTAYVYKAWAIDSAGNISSSGTTLIFTYDNVVPSLTAVTINGGNQYTGTPVVTVSVTATDHRNVAYVRVKEANLTTHECQTEYANDSWQTYATNGVAQDYSYTVSSGDGTKYLCAWAKDAAGNVSTITTPSAGSVAMSSIEFSVGNPPMITSLSVLNNTAGPNFGTTTFTAGNQVKIAYATSDVEGLDNNPISVSYSTDNTNWKDVVTDLVTTDGNNMTWMGSQTGNPTSYTGQYLSFHAPVSTFFRIKVVAKDMAGNTSVAVLSDTLNTPNWSIYAGSADRGVGGSALTAAFLDSDNVAARKFAINPKNNDLYVIDAGFGIKKVDAKTGIVSTFIKYGSNNLSTSGGSITASSAIGTYAMSIGFDSKGLLYVLVYTGESTSGLMYQIDPVNLTSKLYAGGGTVWDATATPSTAYVYYGLFAFDESNSLYYLTSCNAAADGVNYLPVRLMKLTQNSDSTPGSFSVVAGDCTNAATTAAGPVDAVNSPLDKIPYAIGSLAVWNNGQNIVYAMHVGGGAGVRKIINGQSYASNVLTTMKSLEYNPVNQKLYSTYNGNVLEYTVGTGANGDTYTPFVSSSGTGNCLADGVDAASACVSAHKTIGITPGGTVLFEDGPSLNSGRNYAVRYKDSAGKIRTVAGSLPFFGDGLDKGVIRGKIGGIYYKKASEPNQTAFPEALYFMEPFGMVMGKINPSTGITTVLAGTQQGETGSYYVTGTAFDNTKSLRNPYSPGNGVPLVFDGNGLPWFRYASLLASVDSNNQFVARQTAGAGVFWEDSAAGSDPKNSSLYVYGGFRNLTLKNSGIFLFGGYIARGRVRTSKLSYFDFGGNTISNIMNSGTNGVSADVTTPGSLSAVNLTSNCLNGTLTCFSQYRSDQDRLYFSEDTKLRYITAPNSGSSTLITLFTQPAGGSISNFIFSPNNDMIFYLSGSSLYCRNISSGNAWCNDTALNTITGLPTISAGANQFTWRDSTHLLISTHGGYVLEYTLPP